MRLESDNLVLSNKEMGDFLKKLCGRGTPIKFAAKGISMSPFICDGDTIVIVPLSEKNWVGTGDIVACIHPDTGHLIIHRIVKTLKSCYLLKGDNIYDFDGYFKKEDIHGCLKKNIIIKQTHGYRKFIRKLVLLSENFKEGLAFLSRHKILPLFCRLINKILNES